MADDSGFPALSFLSSTWGKTIFRTVHRADSAGSTSLTDDNVWTRDKFEGDFRKKPLSRDFWRELRVSRSFGRVKGSKREIEDKDKGQEGDQGIKDKDRDEAEDKDGGQRRGQIERPNCLDD